ncbi:hypothetical protein cyc_04863 [Cyclospora cayetanensis]|uniref:Uncharacterized protein n=1 Tax=Cyclospora cayetanensis TaxID=88456 RepID=A0A1D3D0X4_9EIME|nr:hypothetical protein cyc_04863 [Cyclospora cayetanensis]
MCVQLVRVRDGCTEWPSLPAIPTDEAFKRRLAAANAVRGKGRKAQQDFSPPFLPAGLFFAVEITGPLETETEGEADASSAAAQEEAGGSQEEGGRCQTAVFAHGDKCNGGGASRKRNSEEVCIAEAPGATDTEADLPAAPRKRRVDGGQFIESSGNTEGDGAAKGQDAP